jgi:tetratricopeptide (TPR) repeat protein
MDRAIADYTQAIRISPGFAQAYYNRGLSYAETGDVDKARADWEQVLRINPVHAGARDNLARLRERNTEQ